jgi:hypothetical protein
MWKQKKWKVKMLVNSGKYKKDVSTIPQMLQIYHPACGIVSLNLARRAGQRWQMEK